MNEGDEKQYIHEENSAENDTGVARIKKIKLALKKCRMEKQGYLLGWQRALADFQNYKKQREMEGVEFRKFANTNLLFKILPILDNLILVGRDMPENERESAWAKGVLGIVRQFEGLLGEEGLEEIKVQIGDKFNPEIHEAIGEAAGAGDSGTISEVVQKGYILYGRVIRAAKVRVIK